MARLVIVADDRDIQYGRSFRLRATEIARQITAQNIASLIGERVLLHAEKKSENSEAELVLWGRAEQHFLAAWSSVSPQSEIVDIARCPLESGLVAEVFSTQSARFQEEPLLQAGIFTNLGDRRGKRVVSMRGLPILVFGECIGVLTWVKYGTEASSPSDENDEVAKWAMIFGRSSELKILKMCMGLESEL
jgi:hypothetical protein